ncbi:MAG: hypothetical protein R2797_05300 [Gelidibacter sp.]
MTKDLSSPYPKGTSPLGSLESYLFDAQDAMKSLYFTLVKAKEFLL